ncbi:hypothetical protein EVAR_60881_1 [Eumeta japonica]|uniref:Uncharacterized protein n=1 Tax=Eumeta variegata TaxID=151549 RepID=A0A4C1YJ06_EUMVA|nr:hypothetical protein EVAR_60881_1 [Eumeta japonica]
MLAVDRIYDIRIQWHPTLSVSNGAGDSVDHDVVDMAIALRWTESAGEVPHSSLPRYPIPIQEPGNALVNPLGLRVFVAVGNYQLFGGSYARLPPSISYEKK